MKLIVRTLLLFILTLWIGGALFFPVIVSEVSHSGAASSFVGTITGRGFHDLHVEGIWAGIAFLIVLYAAHKFKALPKSVLPPAIITIALLVLTVFSQYWIAPRMEHLRTATIAVSTIASNNPNQVSFHKLRYVSEALEVVFAIGGISLMAFLAWNFPIEEQRVVHSRVIHPEST